MQRASGEGIGFDSQCAILYSVKGEIKEKGSPGEAASAAEQHGACSVDVCSGGTGCVLSLCFFFFPLGEHLPFPCSSVGGIRPLLVQKPEDAGGKTSVTISFQLFPSNILACICCFFHTRNELKIEIK